VSECSGVKHSKGRLAWRCMDFLIAVYKLVLLVTTPNCQIGQLEYTNGTVSSASLTIFQVCDTLPLFSVDHHVYKSNVTIPYFPHQTSQDIVEHSSSRMAGHERSTLDEIRSLVTWAR
jgi:hypothetical protein